jgi:diguanylate cyclase (GGDEF)-like protein
MTDPLFFGEDLGAGSNKLYGAHGGIQLQAVVAADIFSQRAEGIRQSIMELQSHYQDQIIQVTCSIGGAMFPKDARNLDQLIELADDMLDKAKQGGKNEVCIYAGEEEVKHT